MKPNRKKTHNHLYDFVKGFDCSMSISCIAVIIVGVSFFACDMFTKQDDFLNTGDDIPVNNNIVFLLYLAGDSESESRVLGILNTIETSQLVTQIPVIALVDRTVDGTKEDDDWSDTRAYRLSYHPINDLELQSQRIDVPELNLFRDSEKELNTGDMRTISHFLAHAKKEYADADTTIILFIVGAHDSWDNIASDWIKKDSKNYRDTLHVTELRQALELQGGVDFIVANHIPMSAEIWYELRNYSRHIVSAPKVEENNLPTWLYQGLIHDIAIAATISDTDAREESIIKAFFNNYRREELSIVRGNGADEIVTQLETIAMKTNNYITTQQRQQEVRTLLMGSEVEVTNSYTLESAYFVDIESMSVVLASIAELTQEMNAIQLVLQQYKDQGLVLQKQIRDDQMGILVYLGEILSGGGSGTVANKYKKRDASAALEFVDRSEYWVADPVANSGFLYTLWMNNSLP